jgi:Sec-independent protein translocase protein TatA
MMKKLAEFRKSMAEAENEEDLEQSKNDISQINSRSRRRSTVFGLNGPLEIPAELGYKVG